MAVIVGNTHDKIVSGLYKACREIVANGDEIVGNIEGVRELKIIITFKPDDVVVYDIVKTKIVEAG